MWLTKVFPPYFQRPQFPVRMLSRAATKITLTPDDVAAYEQRKQVRDAMQTQDMDSSQTSDKSTVENGHGGREEEVTPAAQTRAARLKQAREQRIGVDSSRNQG